MGPKIVVISGQIDYKMLNATLSPVDYAIGKVGVWVRMLNKGERPKRWLKARKTGTKVNFEVIQSEAELNGSIEELKTYVAGIESEHGVQIKLTIGDNEQ